MYLCISKVNGDRQQMGQKGRVGLESASGDFEGIALTS